MLDWFKAKNAEQLGDELAVLLLELMPPEVQAHASRRQSKANYAREKMQKRIEKFRQQEKLNFYKIAKLVNTFKWKLKDAQFDQALADEFGTWLTTNLASR